MLLAYFKNIRINNHMLKYFIPGRYIFPPKTFIHTLTSKSNQRHKEYLKLVDHKIFTNHTQKSILPLSFLFLKTIIKVTNMSSQITQAYQQYVMQGEWGEKASLQAHVRRRLSKQPHSIPVINCRLQH